MTRTFGQPAPAAAQFQLSDVSRRRFADVLASLRAAIDRAGMKVLHEIDPQGALRGVGLEIGGARLVFFFHPDLLARLLALDASAIVEAPLKLAVMEMPGGEVSVRVADPAVAFERYGNPSLAGLGQELSAACKTIVAAARTSD